MLSWLNLSSSNVLKAERYMVDLIFISAVTVAKDEDFIFSYFEIYIPDIMYWCEYTHVVIKEEITISFYFKPQR